MEKKYCVAGHTFCVKSIDDSIWRSMNNYVPFETDSLTNPVFTLEVIGKDSPLSPSDKTEPFFMDLETDPDMPRIDVYKQGDCWLFEFYPTMVSKNCFKLLLSDDFKYGRIQQWDIRRFGRFPIDNALMIQYVSATATLQTIGIHSSVITHSGQAFAFLGISGTGKSTHSKLWLEHIPGSHLLNDDNPVIRIDDKGDIRIYGTPWSGKTPCYRQESAPLKGIIELEQFKENRIFRMPALQAYIAMEASTSGVRQMPKVEEGLFQTLRTIIENVPCYHLQCLPDDAAAQLCAATCGIEVSHTEGQHSVTNIDEVLPVIGIQRHHNPDIKG